MKKAGLEKGGRDENGGAQEKRGVLEKVVEGKKKDGGKVEQV